MAKETAIDWLVEQVEQYTLTFGPIPSHKLNHLKQQAKQMENEQRKRDLKTGYYQGYMDAQCNHINDADNFANEQDYINQ